MNLRPRRRKESDIDLTPLIDCVFILVIFLLVSTTFRKESELTITLPEASQQPVTSQQQLEIAIDTGGRYAVNNQALADGQLMTLMAALAQAAGEQRELPVTIRADAQTAHQAVVRAMDAAGQLGFSQVNIVTVHASGGGPAATTP